MGSGHRRTEHHAPSGSPGGAASAELHWDADQGAATPAFHPVGVTVFQDSAHELACPAARPQAAELL